MHFIHSTGKTNKSVPYGFDCCELGNLFCYASRQQIQEKPLFEGVRNDRIFVSILVFGDTSGICKSRRGRSTAALCIELEPTGGQ
jgi:hypothetical protein